MIPVENAQEKLIQHGIKNRADELLEVSQRSHVLLDNIIIKDEALVITKNNIIEFKDRQTMY